MDAVTPRLTPASLAALFAWLRLDIRSPQGFLAGRRDRAAA